MNEERLRRFRLEADAGPLRDSVLAAARRARREQRVWRWTWVAAAVVIAIAIPVNMSADRMARSTVVARKEKEWPAELRQFVRLAPRSSAAPHLIPRSVEELR